MRTDIENIYNCEIFNKNYMHKVFLMGFMTVKTVGCIAYDIYLKSHNKYYIIKINKSDKNMNTSCSIYDDFLFAKLHTHVIARENKDSPVYFPKLNYYIPINPIALDISTMNTSDTQDVMCDMFQIRYSKSLGNKCIVNTSDLTLCERDDFIKKYFNEKECKEILENWKENDEFQKKCYLRMKEEREGGRYSEYCR